MANRIVEPASTDPDTIDWQNALNKLTKTTGSFLMVGLTNIDNDNEPMVMEGSKFEINGAFFEVSVNETITGYDLIPVGKTAYIYAIPNTPDPISVSLCTFEYSETLPTLNLAKGGWFDGINRCIGWVIKDAPLSYTNKSIAFPILDLRPTNPLRSVNGALRFQLNVVNDITLAQNGDMWLES